MSVYDCKSILIFLLSYWIILVDCLIQGCMEAGVSPVTEDDALSFNWRKGKPLLTSPFLKIIDCAL